MHAKHKYIVLFYDHSERVQPMRQLLEHLPTQPEVDCVENFQQLLKLLDEKLPDLLIVYANNPVESYIDYLKSLRGDNWIDELPVYVFTELPEKQTLIKLLGN